MCDAIAVAVILAIGAAFLAFGWAMLYAATRGRSASDPDKETPPWPEYMQDHCALCGWSWFRLKEDTRPCPNCDGKGGAP